MAAPGAGLVCKPADAAVARLIGYQLEPVVVQHAGAKSARWRLSADERREVRGLLRAGRPTLTALATDTSGNLRTTSTPVSD